MNDSYPSSCWVNSPRAVPTSACGGQGGAGDVLTAVARIGVTVVIPVVAGTASTVGVAGDTRCSSPCGAAGKRAAGRGEAACDAQIGSGVTGVGVSACCSVPGAGVGRHTGARVVTGLGSAIGAAADCGGAGRGVVPPVGVAGPVPTPLGVAARMLVAEWSLPLASAPVAARFGCTMGAGSAVSAAVTAGMGSTAGAGLLSADPAALTLDDAVGGSTGARSTW